jgi:pyridoxal phosphate enzyme (YggS family)
LTETLFGKQQGEVRTPARTLIELDMSDTNLPVTLAARLAHIRAQLADAASAAGRAPDSVRLVAVSKTHPASAVAEALAAGQLDFGENRVQELQDKQPALPDELRWHLIGTLQRNKVKYIAPYVHLIHSVNSPELLAEISRQAQRVGRTIDVLLQLNISHEDQKHGLDAHEAEALLAQITQYPQVRVLGLMGMAQDTPDTDVVRTQFRALATARAAWADQYAGPQVELRELSMGMSGDWPIAVAEGATLVRIGSAIFGSRLALASPTIVGF